jgi:hypothetical protein
MSGIRDMGMRPGCAARHQHQRMTARVVVFLGPSNPAASKVEKRIKYERRCTWTAHCSPGYTKQGSADGGCKPEGGGLCLTTGPNLFMDRRTVLLTSSLLLAPLVTGSSQVAQAARIENQLASRINNSEGNVVQPTYLAPWDPKTIFYPDWTFGEWNVRSKLKGVLTPLGKEYVPPGFLAAMESSGSDASEYSYKLRFYKTLPDTLENNLRFGLGLGQPRGAVIADKSFNTMQMTDAFLGYSGAVSSVEYDVRNSPLRQTVTLSTLGPDLAPLPPRRLELFVNALSSEKEGETIFRTSELARQVFITVNNVQVSDYEVLNEFKLVKDGYITGRQRSFLYLQPQDPLFFKSSGKAVCVYDYGFTMAREPVGEDDPSGAEACVDTPKQVTQCI